MVALATCASTSMSFVSVALATQRVMRKGYEPQNRRWVSPPPTYHQSRYDAPFGPTTHTYDPTLPGAALSSDLQKYCSHTTDQCRPQCMRRARLERTLPVQMEPSLKHRPSWNTAIPPATVGATPLASRYMTVPHGSLALPTHADAVLPVATAVHSPPNEVAAGRRTYARHQRYHTTC